MVAIPAAGRRRRRQAAWRSDSFALRLPTHEQRERSEAFHEAGFTTCEPPGAGSLYLHSTNFRQSSPASDDTLHAAGDRTAHACWQKARIPLNSNLINGAAIRLCKAADWVTVLLAYGFGIFFYKKRVLAEIGDSTVTGIQENYGR
ncbi:hypothetical protein NPIL_624431 [Nephila pilipes]|uniref:Uncharacterized protein n=1 Tax=Nephila pilipes TaxID=299642 RepID=A0A8X6TF14_NEPPI|nr:hypothetical protein NPIL_624431 [Nephila pilipes]